MTVKLASLRANLEREEAGDWVEFPDWPGVAFNVSSTRKPSYVAAHQIMLQRFQRIYKGKSIPRKEEAEELGKLIAKHILHDWKGLDTDYSPERAVDILTDEGYYDSVLTAVLWCASKIAELQVEFAEESAKNFARPSAAGSSAKAKAVASG